MALAGFKKQLNKANQYMSEKIGGAEGTKFTDDFTLMERKTDVTNELVEDLMNKTREYLQPNPATRAKLTVSSKIKGSKTHSYPQPEGTLGDSMCKYGKDLGEDSSFALSLIEMGEALREMSEIKYALEDNVKQNFLEPLMHMQSKDLKDVMHHRKKLEGRRLDYDCKKRKKCKGTHITEDEIKLAEDKFEESFNLASMGMHNLLQNDVEQVSQIAALSEALYEYHSQCANILESLTSRLMEQKNDAGTKSPEPYVPKKLHELNLHLNVAITGDDVSPGTDQSPHYNGWHDYSQTNGQLYNPISTTAHLLNGKTIANNHHNRNSHYNSSHNTNNSHYNYYDSHYNNNTRSPEQRTPCCQALYDFEPENPNELPFNEGDVIQLKSKIDDNWFEGTVNGKSGLFPISYVQVLVPIGH
ncbi:endophilin-A-like isoform X2 [Oppia nitens]|uniref:endophilin-A-like isoform X2 n=1 Tax=Oppia nitens TaxID=1686743 RepID=UPI0023DCB2CA|nr:endophilin-A-like isoform X2 [Oppia nitens]